MTLKFSTMYLLRQALIKNRDIFRHKVAKRTVQPAPPYGIIDLRNSGLAVGNGGIYVKTDHPATYYRPISEIIP